MLQSAKLPNKILAIVIALVCFPLLYHYAVGQWQSERIIQSSTPISSEPTEHKQPPDAFVPSIDTINYLSADALVHLSEVNTSINEQQQLVALKRNPSNGRLAAHLLYTNHTDQQLAELAATLWPSHSYVHVATADFWLSQQRLDKTLEAWNVLLTRRVSSQNIFKMLAQFPAFSDGQALLKPYTEQPPTWWNHYFTYLSRSAPLSSVFSIYQMRVQSAVPISQDERQQFTNRLLKEKQWLLAYTTWLAGLDEEKRQYRQFIYDGGFEDQLFNTPFTWNIKPAKAYQATLDNIRGTKGLHSLKLTFFKKKRIKFEHIAQTLLLRPGSYTLSLRYNINQLKTNKGLNWRLRCNNKSLIAETITFKQQTSDWKTTELNFDVPSHCTTQMLRLEANSPYAHDHLFDGNLWFDELKITKR